MSSRRGVALLLALATVVTMAALGTVSLWGAIGHLRSVQGARFAIEGELAASAALGAARLHHASVLQALLPGEHAALPVLAAGQWSVSVAARRVGPLVELRADAERRTAAGQLLGAHRSTLLLARDASDTLRVLRERARF